ncbi:hypothetical protein Plhal703r1_c58g0163511 [Plasmopara halstedii]
MLEEIPNAGDMNSTPSSSSGHEVSTSGAKAPCPSLPTAGSSSSSLIDQDSSNVTTNGKTPCPSLPKAPCPTLPQPVDKSAKVPCPSLPQPTPDSEAGSVDQSNEHEQKYSGKVKQMSSTAPGRIVPALAACFLSVIYMLL